VVASNNAHVVILMIFLFLCVFARKTSKLILTVCERSWFIQRFVFIQTSSSDHRSLDGASLKMFVLCSPLSSHPPTQAKHHDVVMAGDHEEASTTDLTDDDHPFFLACFS
jgi:hypothetical protein